MSSTTWTQSQHVDRQGIQELNKIFSAWKSDNVRTSKIESDLRAIAKKINITVLYGKEYEVTQDNFEWLCEQQPADDASQLHSIFSAAKVIIGADGAHSVVREVAMQGLFSYDNESGHIAELKYQSSGSMQPRSFSASAKDIFSSGALNFETVSKKHTETLKAVAFRQFIDQETFNSIRVADATTGIIKGVYGNSWTFQELSLEADNNAKVKTLYDHLMTYVSELPERDGDCQNEKITAIPLRIYRSDKAAIQFKDKFVLLVGDAESGIILERGFNKGLKGAALCAQAVSKFFQADSLPSDGALPAPFVSYEAQTQKIFNFEKSWAETKLKGIHFVGNALSSK